MYEDDSDDEDFEDDFENEEELGSYVREPEDVTEILRLLREEIYEVWGVKPEDRGNASFEVHFIPCDLPGSNASFEVINNFGTILKGCISMPRPKTSKWLVVSVLELIIPSSGMNSHSYLVTPIDFSGTFSNFGMGFYSYVFLGSATSGYVGTGPEIQRSIQELIDQGIPTVKQKQVRIRAIDSFQGLFNERGPIVSVWFPDFKIGLKGFDYDDRFEE